MRICSECGTEYKDEELVDYCTRKTDSVNSCHGEILPRQHKCNRCHDTRIAWSKAKNKMALCRCSGGDDA